MLAYADTGAGDPVVLIHGLAATHGIWHHVIPRLAGRRVVAVDVPGFGSSPAAGPGFDLEQVARAIWDGLPTDLAGPVTLVGHSLGSAVALTAACLEPERTAALVLCAPAGLRPLPPAAATALGALGGVAIDLRRMALPLAATPLGRRMLLGASAAAGDSVSEDDVIRMVTASDGATRVGAALETVTTVDLRPLLVKAPARFGVIWGAHDRVIPPSTVDVIRAERPDVLAEVVPGTGHVPMMERPAAFTAVLRQVLDRLGDDVHGIATPSP